ncbi:MAG: PAS domain S-box protein [Chloroflexales bacterium]
MLNKKEQRSLVLLGSLFVVLALGIIAGGYLSHGYTVMLFSVLMTIVGVRMALLWRRHMRSYGVQQEESLEALRVSEARFHRMFENHGAIMLLIEPQTGTIFDANQSAVYFYGYPKATLCAMNINQINTLSPEQVAIEYKKALREERSYFVFPHKLADATERIVEVYSSPISVQEKKVLFSIIHDITDRKHAEVLVYAQRDLARAVSTVRSIQEVLPLCLEIALHVSGMDCGGIYMLDLDERMLELVCHRGLSAEFVRQTSPYPADAPNAQAMLSGKTLYLNAAQTPDIAYLHNEGLHCAGSIAICYQGRNIGCVNIASHTKAEIPTSIRHALEILATEIGSVVMSLRTEEALRKNTQILSESQSIANLASWTADIQVGTFVGTTRGSQPLEWITDIGTMDDLIAVAHPDDRGYVRSSWTAALQGAPYNVEYRIILSDEIRWVHVKARITYGQEQHPISALGILQDITERKQADAQLRESQLRLELTLKGANMGLWDFYVQTGATVFNDRWAEIVGYTLAELEPISIQTWEDLCHPDDLQRSNALLEQHFRREIDFYECEARMKHKNGEWVWVIDHGKVVEWDASDRPVRMAGTHLDITERKHAEQELRELNRTLEERVNQRTAEVQDLYENAPSGYHSLDTNGCLIRVNQTELTWLGYSRDEMIGRPFTDFITARSHSVFVDNYPTFMQRGWIRSLEYELVRKDGTILDVLLDATAIYDARGTYVMSRSTIFDNTERRKAELALRKSEEQNRLLFEESPDAIVLFDDSGRMKRLNHAFELLTGYTAEQLTGNTLSDMGLVSHEQVVALGSHVLQHIQSNNRFATVELWLKHASGEMYDVGVRVFGLTLRDHQHYLAAMHDITIEKKAEETMRRANSEFARASRTKDEFLANMSHELRTPLNAILALSESLLEEVQGPLNTFQQGYLHQIGESGHHLLTLINDILDLSKVEAGRLDIQVDVVSVADICQSSIVFVKEIALKKSLKLALHLNDQMAEIEVDSRRLKQMLVNLLSNAVKFTPARGHVILEVNADAEMGVVRFAVEDNGIGIAPDDIAKLFHPFKQLDSSLSRQHEGTGLGLALVRRLAELHGGSVTVESHIGRGSRFTITLPQRFQNQEPVTAIVSVREKERGYVQQKQPLPAPTGAHILLVEDSEVNLQALRDYLLKKGYRVEVARNGREALEQTAMLLPDLILMDIQMPEMDGLEAIQRLRARSECAQTPIIALTALAMAGDRERCLAAGANVYMSKPISLKELVEMIEQLLKGILHKK